MDDVSFGAPDEHQAYQLYSKARTRLAEAGFNLRKFSTNSTSLQQQVDSHVMGQSTPPATAEEDRSFAKTSLGVKGEEKEKGEDEHRVLGVRWNCKEDNLIFTMKAILERLEDEIPTKREVVGIAATIFDPLGMISPVTVLWKMLFQSTCKAGLQWDEKLTGEPLKEWRRLKAAMGEDVTITIPRCYNTSSGQKARLVGFCDASERAYAAVVYLRTGEERAETRLVASKKRVAPIKEMTIPRLELLSALLLANLCKSIEEALREVLQLEETICFTDSKVSLHWIQGVDQEWKQFVENRATTIRLLIPAANWRHCPGVENPADIPSRGMLAQELGKEMRWLSGPEWLTHSLNPPIGEKSEEPPEECLVERKKCLALINTSRGGSCLSQLIKPEKYSSLKKLLAVTALVMKFRSLTRKEDKTPHELQREARMAWLKEAQKELETDKDFQSWKKQFGLERGEDGLWRCVGRLASSSLDATAKQPILLGRKHHLTRLIATRESSSMGPRKP